jgi:ABC-type branched-subunit amino acid transport system ATPase component
VTAAEAGALLEIDALRLSFGGVAALDGVSFSVRQGAVTGLIGPNGAGKTTLFNTVSGMYRPSSGRVRFDGHDITGLPPERVTNAGLVRSFQIARGLPTLTVIENLMLYGERQPGETLWKAIVHTSDMRRREALLREQAWQMLGRLELQHVADNLASDLSGGQKKLIELGRVLMRRPRMILLDEPAAGVNPSLARLLGAHIRACRDDGITFLVVEHNMALIGDICDEVVVMAEGRCLMQGDFESVRNDHRVQTAYMGRAA